MRTSIAVLVANAGILLAQTSAPIQIESWVTNPDRSALFQKQTAPAAFSGRNNARGGAAIVIDDAQQMQSIDGFGFALTG
jgi:glucosylceramidase